MKATTFKVKENSRTFHDHIRFARTFQDCDYPDVTFSALASFQKTGITFIRSSTPADSLYQNMPGGESSLFPDSESALDSITSVIQT